MRLGAIAWVVVCGVARAGFVKVTKEIVVINQHAARDRVPDHVVRYGLSHTNLHSTKSITVSWSLQWRHAVLGLLVCGTSVYVMRESHETSCYVNQNATRDRVPDPVVRYGSWSWRRISTQVHCFGNLNGVMRCSDYCAI